MQFVNLTAKTVYTTYSGTLRPGQVSADGGPKRRKLEDLLNEIVKVCGTTLGIRLNAAEAQLLNKLMTLDEKGGSFNKRQLPPEVRDDPTGAKRAAASVLAAQQKEAAARDAANRKGAQVEAEINGEAQTRKPVGPGNMQGVEVKSGDLKSGFEQIIEENARIAAGDGEGSGEKKNVGEILDPIGAHAKQPEGEAVVTDAGAVDGAENAPGAGDGAAAGADAGAALGADAGEPSGAGAESAAGEGDGDKSIGTEPAAVPAAKGLDDDGTRSADTTPPPAQAPEKGSKMDQNAAVVAAGLDQLGPVKGKGKGKGKNKGQK